MYKDPEVKKAKAAEYREKNRQKLRDKQRLYRRSLKQQVLDYYGNSCKKCGYKDVRALQIDHINNNGAEERKSLGSQNVSGWRFYQYLIAKGLPDGYQTLCANCNMIKQLGENF
ncbi:MAG: hypothetical protein ACKOXV_02165 [Bacteroidota bacterium]